MVLRVIVERGSAPAAFSNMLTVAALTTVLGRSYREATLQAYYNS